MKKNYFKRIVAFMGFMVLATGMGYCQYLIDQTYIAGGSDLYGPMNIDNTGIVSRRTNFGSRINYNDGAYFRGIVQNGKRKAGTIYFPNGRTESCSNFDENGKFNAQAAIEYADGSWFVGYFSHGDKHGQASACYIENGRKVYYDEVWRNNSRISATRVSAPSMNITSWNPPVEMPVSNGSSSRNGNSRSSRSSCPYCRGTGMVESNRSVGTYGLNNNKRKCATCGKWIMSGTAHSHSRCSHCGGTGNMR